MDACRNVVRHAPKVISLASRPVLFALARALGEAWPDVETPRRVHSGRSTPMNHIAHGCESKWGGFTMLRTVAGEGDEAGVRPGTAPCTRGGQRWRNLPKSTTSMRQCSRFWRTASRGPARSALALGASQRTVQRALDSLAAAGKGAVVRSRAGPALDDAPRRRIHDDLATPGSAAGD